MFGVTTKAWVENYVWSFPGVIASAIDELLSGGLQPVRTVLRALALRQMDEGRSTPAVGVSLGLSAKAVWQIVKRYQQSGLDRALFDGARAGKAPALDQEQRQRIIAVACSPPPEGRARWTVRLLTEEAIRRKLVPRVGRETLRGIVGKPRLEAVAGKKCGAWRSWMRSTSPAWRTC